MTFVHPGTNISTVVDEIRVTALTGTYLPWHARITLYDQNEKLINTWALEGGFCREPPFYYGGVHFSEPGRIARVECELLRAGIEDVIVTESSTPVEGTTWSRIKAVYR